MLNSKYHMKIELFSNQGLRLKLVVKKRKKFSPSNTFDLFFATRLIDSIIQKHSRNILYLCDASCVCI